MRSLELKLMTLITLACLAWPAAAQQPAVDVQHFQPHGDRTGWFVTQSAATLELWQPAFGLWLSYARDPLMFTYGGEVEEHVVSDLLTADLQAAIGFGFADLAIDVPIHLSVAGDGRAEWGSAFSATAVGDMRLIPKVRFLDPADGFGLGLALPVSFPTGSEANYVGMRTVSVSPTVAATGHFGRARVGGNLGVRIAGKEEIGDVSQGTAFLFRVAGGYSVIEQIDVGAEIYGDVGGNARANPVEWLAGATFRPVGGLDLRLAGGTAFGPGIGSPKARIVFGVGWSKPTAKDTDGDGINDPVDRCVDSPEDADGFEDKDGCPDLDNDNDGIFDAQDGCPNDPEDMDGFEDGDGCPDTDNDGDGVLDVDDECPDTPEDEPDGWEDGNGCPDPDNDNDNFLDADDACPDEAEVLNGVDDEDGCPDEAVVELDVERKEIHIMEKVYFDYDKATIKRESHAILDAVVDLLGKFEYVTLIEIQGHTDAQGEDADNQVLSQERADSVRQYMIDHGVAPERLVAKGYGETRLIDGADTDEAHAANRRVQFIVLEMAE